MSGFRDLAERLRQLEKVPSRCAKATAARIQALLSAQFMAAVNAYGNPWKALLPQTVRRKGGDSRILIREGNLAASPKVQATSGAGIQISVAETGSWHQNGTKHMVPRKILPDGNELPAAWRDAIVQSLSEAVKANA